MGLSIKTRLYVERKVIILILSLDKEVPETGKSYVGFKDNSNIFRRNYVYFDANY